MLLTHKLWFDVNIDYYKTSSQLRSHTQRLWFDVNIVYYTFIWENMAIFALN
jgi:hypothetical protein